MDANLSPAPDRTTPFDYHVTGQRVAAALIDLIPLVVLFLVMAATMGEFGSTDDGQFNISLTNGPALLYVCLVLAYYIVLEGLTATTLGKWLLGLKVIRVDGAHYGWKSAFLRNILRIIDGLPFLYLVGIVAIAVTQNRQRLGDLAARTLVVRAAYAPKQLPG